MGIQVIRPSGGARSPTDMTSCTLLCGGKKYRISLAQRDGSKYSFIQSDWETLATLAQSYIASNQQSLEERSFVDISLTENSLLWQTATKAAVVSSRSLSSEFLPLQEKYKGITNPSSKHSPKETQENVITDLKKIPEEERDELLRKVLSEKKILNEVVTRIKTGTPLSPKKIKQIKKPIDEKNLERYNKRLRKFPSLLSFSKRQSYHTFLHEEEKNKTVDQLKKQITKDIIKREAITLNEKITLPLGSNSSVEDLEKLFKHINHELRKVGLEKLSEKNFLKVLPFFHQGIGDPAFRLSSDYFGRAMVFDIEDPYVRISTNNSIDRIGQLFSFKIGKEGKNPSFKISHFLSLSVDAYIDEEESNLGTINLFIEYDLTNLVHEFGSDEITENIHLEWIKNPKSQ